MMMYARVCTINENTIDIGTDYNIVSSSVTNDPVTFVAIKLTKSKVLIANNYSNSVYGIVCNIDGTSITTHRANALISDSANVSQRGNLTCTYLEENDFGIQKVFLAFQSNSTATVNGCVCTINGTLITPGTTTKITTYSASSTAIQCISSGKLTTNQVLVTYANNTDTSQKLAGMICAISGTTITSNATSLLSTQSKSGTYSSIAVLNDTKAIIIHSRYYSSSINDVYGVVVNILNNEIITATDTLLYHYYKSVLIATKIINKNTISIIGVNANLYLYLLVSKVNNDDTINLITEQTLSQNNNVYIRTITCDNINNKLFIAFAYSSSSGGGAGDYPKGLMVEFPEINKVKQLESSNDEIAGVAQSSGSAGETVKVIEPNFN